MSSFVGHFHPVFVHLPIGILILAFVLQFIERRKQGTDLTLAINVSLFIGMITAVLSCITGYFLSISDDYDEGLVSQHQWLGIGVAVIAILLYFLRRGRRAARWHWPLMIVLIVLVTLTGHIGGSLTHGSDYLTRAFTGLSSGPDTVKRAVIANVQEAAVYQQLIQPLFQEKCYSCHNKNKQKGGLRMDEPALLLKGGKSGLALQPGQAAASELYNRLLLPREHEDHMPPKEKPQLTESEIALIHWWIASGASFDKQVKELEQPAAVKPLLAALQQAVPVEKKAPPSIPAAPVGKADDSALKRIRDLGVVVLPVARNSNYLSASFVTAGGVGNGDLALLLPVKKQLAWLRLSLPAINDSAISFIVQCTSITRLQLDHTGITDAGLSSLKALKQLQYLNLVGTKVTAAGLLQLKGLNRLQSIYCYRSGVGAGDHARLQEAFPGVHIDMGGYQVPVLATDTTEVKPATR